MVDTEARATEYTIKPLTPDTWDSFVDLAERNNGVLGRCWCAWFHAPIAERKPEGNRAFRNAG